MDDDLIAAVDRVEACWARFAPSVHAASTACGVTLPEWMRPTSSGLDHRLHEATADERAEAVRRSHAAVIEALPPGTMRTHRTSARDIDGGRFLLWTDTGVDDGAAAQESGGLFDWMDRPPAWTWVPGSDVRAWIWNTAAGAMLAWIPAELVPRATRGIEVNPVDALAWLEVADSALDARLRAILGAVRGR